MRSFIHSSFNKDFFQNLDYIMQGYKYMYCIHECIIILIYLVFENEQNVYSFLYVTTLAALKLLVCDRVNQY